jgi:hypothetical protein
MADIRCPNCGRNNPDFLDVCQFCQTPLKPESTLHTGDSPVKKNTGELEPILPQWLKDMRQQARDSAEADAAADAARPKIRNEPPDLLAGLASQARDDREEIPDWLASINPVTKPKIVEAESDRQAADFFAQFNKSEAAPAGPPKQEPEPEEVPSWMTGAPESQPVKEEKDELSEWFARAAAEPEQTVEVEQDAPSGMRGSDAPSFKIKEPEPPKEEEDLGWLHILEASAGQPAGPAAPRIDAPGEGGIDSSLSAPGGEDLSWLNELGGGQAFAPGETVSASQGVQPEPIKPEPAAEPQGDLSWLDQLGDNMASASGQEPAPVESPSQENPDWLKLLEKPPAVSAENPAGDDLSWLQAADEKEEVDSPQAQASRFTPRRTGPLEGESTEDSMPDWLKSATEEPSMPAPGALSEWFRESSTGAEGRTPPSKPQPVPVESDLFAPSTQPSSLSNQDVDSLLSSDMPDWFSGTEDRTEEKPPTEAIRDDSLAPVELPAWVQAMRPVESVIAEAPSVESQPTEKEGPLAGLRGVIPAAPIGSALRPKAISLKLQASDEQQAGAALLEQILAGETNPKPLITTDFVASQRVVRWIVSGLFIIVLSTMIFLGTQSMPVSAALPVQVSRVSDAIANIPQNSSVLVVLDYEPAVAGELEAVSGPMLDQMALLRRPRLSFLSTSPNSSALVERLLRNTNITLPPPIGLDYKTGADYLNIGYLPGGASGVFEFVESPNAAMPAAGINAIAEYAAVILLTDHSESARVWIEQLDARRRVDASLASQPLLVAASAQAGPLLQPYVSSRQITGMVSGLSDAARYEFVNSSRPGIARRYWDSFGVGLLMAIALIASGSLWSLISGIRARRAEAELG